MSENSRPVKVIRSGEIEAAIWANQGNHGWMFSVTFTRKYKTQTEWKSTGFIKPEQLGTMMILASTAAQWIMAQNDQSRGSANAQGQQQHSPPDQHPQQNSPMANAPVGYPGGSAGGNGKPATANAPGSYGPPVDWNTPGGFAGW